MSYTVLVQVESKARTLKGINKALDYLADENNPVWFETQEDLDRSIREGFIEFTKTKIIIYADGE